MAATTPAFFDATVPGRFGCQFGYELSVGALSLFGELPLTSAHVLEGIARGLALLASACRQAGAKLQGPKLLSGERGTSEGVILLPNDEMPAQHGELSRRSHHCDLGSSARSDPLLERPQRTRSLGRDPRRLD